MHLHDTILYSFLVAGHTKFGPDRCFGMIKKTYKVTYVSLLLHFEFLFIEYKLLLNNQLDYKSEVSMSE